MRITECLLFMGKNKLDVEMNEAEKKIIENIEKHGCHVTSVFDNSGKSPSFTYTTGVQKSHNAPEVLIIGLPNKLAASVANNYMRRVSEGEVFEIGEFYKDFLANFDITFGNVSLRKKKEYMLSSCWFYKDNFDAMQLIYPTTEGIWPWDENADDDFHKIQPSLGEPAAW